MNFVFEPMPALQRYIYHSPRSQETGSKALLSSLVFKKKYVLFFKHFRHFFNTVKLDDGWPESEKRCFSSSSEDGSRKR